MSAKVERTFVVKVPVERAWKAFTRPDEREAWMSPPGHDPVGSPEAGWPGAGLAPMEVKPRKVERHRLLEWSQQARRNAGSEPVWVEMSVTFEEVESGTKITLTQSGFGDTAEWFAHNEAVSIGVDESIADLILYLETGVRAIRHHSFKSSIGAELVQSPRGLTIATVARDGFAAEAGLQPGDVIVRLAGGPVFTQREIGFVTRAFEGGTEIDVEYVRGDALLRGRAALGKSYYVMNRADVA